MSDETEDTSKQTCRLCAEDHEVTITLFGQESQDMLLQEKLSKYLLIELVEKDNLPKNICIQCCTKLNSLCSFVEEVRQAQLTFCFDFFRQKNYNRKEGKNSTVDKTDDNEPTSADNVTDASATIRVILDDDDPPNCKIINDDPKNTLTPRKSFSCGICKRGFITDLALKSHVWTHKIKKMKLKEIADKYQERETTEYKELYHCHLCSRRFRTQRTFDDHMVMHSEKTNIQTCKVCGRAYKSWASLKAHNLTHSTVKPHTCHLCPKTFKRKLELEVHLNQHTGRRPYKCPHCDRTFASASNCHTHRTRMHPGKGAGRRPGRSKTKDKKEVEIDAEHIEVKCNLVNDKGLFKYQCEQCTHRFSTRENYLCHMFQHTGKKRFKCSLCPAEFITRKGLTLHCFKLHPNK